MPHLINPTLDRLEQRLLEAYDELSDSFVDPFQPYNDDGENWLPLTGNGHPGSLYAAGPANEVATRRNSPPMPHLGTGERIRHQRP